MIVTLSEVKEFLQISADDTTKDTLITLLIPQAESKYLEIRNRPFSQFKGDLTTSDKTISNLMVYPTDYDNDLYSYYKFFPFQVMEYVFNSTNSIDNYITDINKENNTIEIDSAATTTAEEVIFTVYPIGCKLTAAKLIQYFMDTSSMNGMKSESIGSYSYTRSGDGNPYGVPDDVYRSIRRHIGSKP